jgi:hypothetical protein
MPNRKGRKRGRRGDFVQSVIPSWIKVVAILLIGFVVFYILVDPGSYSQAILHPVDTGFQNRTVGIYITSIGNSGNWFLGNALYLWTPALVLAAPAGLILLIRREWRKPSHVLILMLLWLLCLAPLFLLHLPGMSGENGYLPFVAPVTLLASFALLQLKRLWLTIALVIILATMVPAAVLFGHRLMLLPFNSYLNNIDSETSLSRPTQYPVVLEKVILSDTAF